VIIFTPSTSYHLHRTAEHLAPDILDGQLHGLDFTGRQVAIDAREAVHHGDLERRGRLGLRHGHEGRGREPDGGGDHAAQPGHVCRLHACSPCERFGFCRSCRPFFSP
jgi:hypothetical protein